MAEQVSNDIKQKIISELIKTAAGRQRLASSMVQPLRRRRDYTSVARKAYLVEQLPDGALPIYDRDPDVTAYVVGEEGEGILAIAKSQRVMFPLFEIASNPEIPLTQVKERRFDLIERAQDLAKVEIQAQEDTKSFAVMNAVAQAANAPNQVIELVAPITPATLADAFADVEKWDLRVARIFMNARDYTDIRKFGRDILDIESQATLLKTGLMAYLWGAQIIVSRIVPQGTVYICAEPEFFGRMPVRTELTVLSADTPKMRLIGFSVFENLGMGIHNPLALQTLSITRA